MIWKPLSWPHRWPPSWVIMLKPISGTKRQWNKLNPLKSLSLYWFEGLKSLNFLKIPNGCWMLKIFIYKRAPKNQNYQRFAIR